MKNNIIMRFEEEMKNAGLLYEEYETEIRKEAKQEFIEMIDKLENKHNTWEDMDDKLRQSDRIGVLEELKKSLGGKE